MLVLIAVFGNAANIEFANNPSPMFSGLGENIPVNIKITDFLVDNVTFILSCPGTFGYFWNDYPQDPLLGPNNSEVLFLVKPYNGVGMCTLKVIGHGTDTITNMEKSVSNENKIDVYIYPPVTFPENLAPSQPLEVYRVLQAKNFPGGYHRVMLMVVPVYNTMIEYADVKATGLVVTEVVPEGLKLITDNEQVGFSAFSDSEISSYKFDPVTRELKMVLMDSDAVGPVDLYYTVKSDPAVVEPGSTLTFDGTWVTTAEVLGETKLPTKGNTTITLEGVKIPDCPITDEELVGYVDKWAKMGLAEGQFENDFVIQQVIEVWESC